MKPLSRLRQWANRDDGRFFRIGNEAVGSAAAPGIVCLVFAGVLWQFDDSGLVLRVFAVALALIGLAALVIGLAQGRHDDET